MQQEKNQVSTETNQSIDSTQNSVQTPVQNPMQNSSQTSAQNQTLEQNIKNTFNLVSAMMNADNVDNQTRTAITSMINLTLNSETYITTIREQVKTIISDGIFNQNDFPAVLSIVVNSKAFLKNVFANSATIVSNLDMHILKYIIYAVIHFVMVLENSNPEIVASFDTMFSPLWNLVSINPHELVEDISIITNKCFSCFPCIKKK
jgi:hypothetical protein